MSLFNASDRISPVVDRQAAARRLTPLLYAATLFVSALLLFSIQPMFAKMVLPKLGGAPAVWSVAMVFFQTVLLAGYAYAHLLNRLLPPRWAAVFHLAAARHDRDDAADRDRARMGRPAIGWERRSGCSDCLRSPSGCRSSRCRPARRCCKAGLPRSGHKQAGNPYVLYAASNLGSFAALFAYPVIVEPFLTLKTQTAAWSIGFALLAVLLSVVGLFAARAVPAAAQAEAADDVRAECRRADAVDRTWPRCRRASSSRSPRI